MNLATVLAVLALALIVTLAVIYIVREKKRGVKCIGCPYADSCQKHCAPHPKAK
ncbi:MAG: FeoB-associated Cys-rich membrane protein [Pyramidobacter sp.]|nr:FeoB-associated Cys-rich membrane protein [Pyramidobacter sp.]